MGERARRLRGFILGKDIPAHSPCRRRWVHPPLARAEESRQEPRSSVPPWRIRVLSRRRVARMLWKRRFVESREKGETAYAAQRPLAASQQLVSQKCPRTASGLQGHMHKAKGHSRRSDGGWGEKRSPLGGGSVKMGCS